MCRTLVFSTALDFEQQAKALRYFRTLADCGCVPVGSPAGHRDGWGIAGYSRGKVLLKKSIKDASEDALYSRFTKSLLKKAPAVVVGHLRNSTVGKRSTRNNQPFFDGQYVFAHFGTVVSSAALPLSKASLRKLQGQTDSEKLFRYVLEKIGKSKTPSEIRRGFLRAVRSTRNLSDYTSMNVTFSNGAYVWVLRDFNPRNRSVRTRRLGAYFYTTYAGYDRSGRLVAIASEKLPLRAVRWKLVPNRKLVQWNVKTGQGRIFAA